MTRTVVVLQHRLMHYRTEFFEKLRQACEENSLELRLVHGQPSPADSKKNDSARLSWATLVHNKYLKIGGTELIWQGLPGFVRSADLVIVMQENRILSNYPILVARRWKHRPIAFWGHGANFQSGRPNGLRERWKRYVLRQVDWWFAYTDISAKLVRSAGFPVDRISCLNNAIDNASFARDLNSLTPDDVEAERLRLFGELNGPVGIFCGSMYADKQLPELMIALDRIRAAIPDFKFVFVGAGPLQDFVETEIQHRGWIRWVGAKRGREKALYFKMSSVVLNPGLVGLHVLDAFTAGKPMFTRASARHSPEIAYLQDGENGRIVPGSIADFSDNVVAALSDPKYLNRIADGARRSAAQYTLEAMVGNFVEGILACCPPARP